MVLSDHGETFTERYWQLDHGGQVFDEQIRIPQISDELRGKLEALGYVE